MDTFATPGRHRVGEAVTARIVSTSTDSLSVLAENIWNQLVSIKSTKVGRADKASLIRTQLERE